MTTTLDTILSHHIKDKDDLYKVKKKIARLLPDEVEVKCGRDGKPLIRELKKVGYNLGVKDSKKSLGLE